MPARRLPLGPSTKEMNSRNSWKDHTLCCRVWRPGHFGCLPPKRPDQFCVTLENGDCVSTDPRCMHQPLPVPEEQT